MPLFMAGPSYDVTVLKVQHIKRIAYKHGTFRETGLQGTGGIGPQTDQMEEGCENQQPILCRRSHL